MREKRQDQTLDLNIFLTEEMYDVFNYKKALFDYTWEEYIKYLLINDNSKELVKNDKYIYWEEEMALQAEILEEIENEKLTSQNN